MMRRPILIMVSTFAAGLMVLPLLRPDWAWRTADTNSSIIGRTAITLDRVFGGPEDSPAVSPQIVYGQTPDAGPRRLQVGRQVHGDSRMGRSLSSLRARQTGSDAAALERALGLKTPEAVRRQALNDLRRAPVSQESVLGDDGPTHRTLRPPTRD